MKKVFFLHSFLSFILINTLFQTTNLYSFTASQLLYNRETKKCVLIYGDIHSQQLDEINKEHVHLFIQHCYLPLQEWCQENNRTMEFILETPDLTSEEIRKAEIEQHRFIAITFKELLLYRNKNRSLTTNFTPYEGRTLESDIIAGLLLNDFEVFLKSILPAYSKKQKAYEAFKKALFQKIKLTLTVEQYFDLTNTQIRNIKNKIDTVMLANKTTLLSQLEQARNSLIKVENLFRQHNVQLVDDLETTIVRIVEELAIKKTTPVTEVIVYLKEIFLEKLDHIIGNLLFTLKIIESQSNHDLTIFATGAYHVDTVTNVLKEANYAAFTKKEIPTVSTLSPSGITNHFFTFPAPGEPTVAFLTFHIPLLKRILL